MSKHTPEVWKHGLRTEHGTHGCGLVFDGHGAAVASVYGLPTNGDLDTLDTERFGKYIERARLIAATPELLEALELMVEWYARRVSGSDEKLPIAEQPAEVRGAMQVIAKATGAGE